MRDFDSARTSNPRQIPYGRCSAQARRGGPHVFIVRLDQPPAQCQSQAPPTDRTGASLGQQRHVHHAMFDFDAAAAG